MGTTGAMQMPLRWAPTADKHLGTEATDALRLQAVQIGAFVDVRPDKAIGRNTETRINDQPAGDWIVSTPDDVGAFLAEGMRSILATSGITTVTTGATRVIRAEVQTLHVA